MLVNRSVLAVVPARGGSKGLPRKNLRPFLGRPLIEWTLGAARAAKVIDRLIVSSDDPEIMALANKLGCEAPFRRSPELSGDQASSIDVVLDTLDRLPGFDIVVLLQPTSPLRTHLDVEGALDRMAATGAPACVSVTEARSHPWLVLGEAPGGRIQPFVIPPPGASLRRQDLPPAWMLNGAVYVAEVDWLRRERTFLKPGETALWPMPPERSIDIDTLEDFEAAERLARG